QFGPARPPATRADPRVEATLKGGQPRRLEPGHRRVKCFAVEQTDILHGRTAPQPKRLAQLPYAQWVLVVASAGNEPFEPYGVDGVGFDPQPVAVRLSLDRPVRQCLPQSRNQTLQGIRGVGRRVLAPNPVDERRLRDGVTWFEGKGDQQRAQPGARHIGGAAVVRANLERSEHPDLHLGDFAMVECGPRTAHAAAGYEGVPV